MQDAFVFFRAARGWLFLGGGLLLGGCKQVCGDNLPEYKLSATQRAWGDPYVVGKVWRFRNAAGTERTYEVRRAEAELIGSGGTTKVSVCPTYYQEVFFANLVRTDTTGNVYERTEYLQLAAAFPSQAASHSLQWHSAYFALPLDDVDSGQLPLPAATLGGHTYAHVLDRTNTGYPITQHLYLTKADGVVAFADRYGTLWTRQ